MALPIPREAPVTSARLPLRSKSSGTTGVYGRDPPERVPSSVSASLPVSRCALLRRLIAGTDRRARHRREDLLLVVDKAALVRGHARGVVRRYEERVDVPLRDGQAEVIADERVGRARVAMPRARHLPDAADMLVGVHGVPGVLRDPHVAADCDRAGTAVLVGLQRHVDAEVRTADILRKDARIVRTRRATVVEGDRDRARRPRRDGGLELVGGDTRVDVVVHYDRG